MGTGTLRAYLLGQGDLVFNLFTQPGSGRVVAHVAGQHHQFGKNR